jgi:uncharacterized protein YneR
MEDRESNSKKDNLETFVANERFWFVEDQKENISMTLLLAL